MSFEASHHPNTEGANVHRQHIQQEALDQLLSEDQEMEMRLETEEEIRELASLGNSDIALKKFGVEAVYNAFVGDHPLLDEEIQ